MATTVKITETFDLKTTVDKLGIIGIHTPGKNLIRSLYPGLVKNHRFMRLNKCDVTGVCASVLPADPLQVGVASGDVAPEDMFNPILYKPVSNESFETIQSMIYQGTDVNSNGQGSINKTEIASNPFDVYYSLLAEAKHWRKAMPQNGFGLRGLYPICYQMVNTFGNSQYLNSTDTANVRTTSNTFVNSNTGIAVSFRGKSVKMPKFPLHNVMEGTIDATQKVDIGDFVIPKTYVACLVIPPARLHEFYYRMRVTWTISFIGVCSTNEYATKSAYLQNSGFTYANDYTYSSSKTSDMMQETDLVDADNVDIKKIMES